MAALAGNGLYMSPQQDVDSFGVDDTPYLDYLDGDNSFDFDSTDLTGDMIGALPGGDGDGSGDGQHEKRKSPDDDNEDDEEGDHKRQEKDGDQRGAKKPGRKPLTSEPTTVSFRTCGDL